MYTVDTNETYLMLFLFQIRYRKNNPKLRFITQLFIILCKFTYLLIFILFDITV